VGSKELKQAGLKVTLPRMKILDMLQQQDSMHMTAEAIYRALIDSGEEIGLARRNRLGDRLSGVDSVRVGRFG